MFIKLSFVMMLCLFMGCASSVSSTKFYLLSALPATDQVKAMSDTAVEINVLALPQYLDRPQIVFRSNENRMKMAEFDQWGGNLRKNIMRTVSQNLMTLLHSPYITTIPQLPRLRTEFRVDIEIVQFERDAQQRVILNAHWSVSDKRVNPPKTITISNVLRSPPVLEQGNFDATVAAMSRLLEDLSHRIAANIQHRMKTP
ncbi:MAG: PqiC family protein [Mariprofundaceae bacterium]|nr:PqiC family protein [Mariprofundaceae bacterium]